MKFLFVVKESIEVERIKDVKKEEPRRQVIVKFCYILSVYVFN